VGERVSWGGGRRRTKGRGRWSPVRERWSPVRERWSPVLGGWAARSAVTWIGAVARRAPIFIPRFRGQTVAWAGAVAGASAATRLPLLLLGGWLSRHGFWGPRLRRLRGIPVNPRFVGARRPLVVR
jgi:hypothetical protein